MGLGKTIQVLALIAAAKRTSRKHAPTEAKTLIVAPAALLDQWHGEIERRADGLTAYKWWGPARKRRGAIRRHDIILASYEEVSRLSPTKGAPSALHEFKWDRVFLDEGHKIANITTKRAIGCIALRATHRWILSGTPIQNTIDDAYSLFRFIEAPFWRDLSFFQD
ncbi:hypothetical protein CALCODRAFT_408111, partial [Calocera cornea HHB12733]